MYQLIKNIKTIENNVNIIVLNSQFIQALVSDWHVLGIQLNQTGVYSGIIDFQQGC